jgi:hypothetical protein
MRGRHMFIGDKNRDQYMRCEFFKQANENEEVLNEQKNIRFLDHVKYYEEQIAMRKDKDTKAMPISVIQALQKKSLRDFKPLKTKAFDFSQQVVRNMSANNSFGQGAQNNLGSMQDIQRQASINMMSKIRTKAIADIPGYEPSFDSIGSM